ncbi:protein of unknown function (plasmid) [Cupriavidus taiwanensis]|uniref:Uncharacterized protein n=1 Tax=Cupriavidus taiwanensis TaxID=164546 RepID=A0A7Z7JFZ6_9BURK|nr:hypothetical protein CBM2597_U30098 [Cupriavidus taiwanensis]SOZ97064.1 hypothetical protein CBM2598_U30104 [Cupriavidus taiwanensis]SPC25881.1 hypothetical protein CBM2594_U20068 [Cupriavidus taiwanensis]SPD38094.1 protein of unknown function [Cupriavidus taiwanensis]
MPPSTCARARRSISRAASALANGRTSPARTSTPPRSSRIRCRCLAAAAVAVLMKVRPTMVTVALALKAAAGDMDLRNALRHKSNAGRLSPPRSTAAASLTSTMTSPSSAPQRWTAFPFGMTAPDVVRQSVR